MREHTIVVGLGFGDEAKGATVAHLADTIEPSAVVRFNGGAQTAHNVIHGGRRHTFRQFGSGTFSAAPTYLSRHVLVDPWAMAAEVRQLDQLGVRDPLGLMRVSPHALVVTPPLRAANRTREDLRGGSAHGSCGLGIGETRWYSLAHAAQLRAGDTLWDITADADADVPPITVADCAGTPGVELRQRLLGLADFYNPLLVRGGHQLGEDFVDEAVATLTEFGRAVTVYPDDLFLSEAGARGPLIFEGAQGVLLDEWRGLHPHTTWSTTLPAAAQELLASAAQPRATVLGVLRTYATRHGHGPLPTEDPALLGVLPEPHNGAGRYQGRWRVGHLDLPLASYAAEVCRRHGGLDALAVSHLDTAARAGGAIKVARRYRGGSDPYPLGVYRDLDHQSGLTRRGFTAVPELEPIEAGAIPEELESATAAALKVVACGPDVSDRQPVTAGVSALATRR